MTDYERIAELLFGHIDKTVDFFEEKYPPRALKEGARVTRFAPSPTGYLHMGGLFGALTDILTAKSTGGISMLRIEDTDKKREVGDGVSAILDGFAAFGLTRAFALTAEKKENTDLIHSRKGSKFTRQLQNSWLKRARHTPVS